MKWKLIIDTANMMGWKECLACCLEVSDVMCRINMCVLFIILVNRLVLFTYYSNGGRRSNSIRVYIGTYRFRDARLEVGF